MAKKIKCPICGKKYEGDKCPECGAPAPKKKSGKLKWIILAIVIIIIILIIIGGAGSEDSSENKSDFTKTTVSEESSDTNEDTTSNTEKNDEKTDFKEIALLESDDYTIKITDISNGILTDYKWTLYIENNTDKNITVSLNNISVDGAMSDPFWATEVAAGKNGYSGVEWYNLSAFGITDPTIIEGSLTIYDSDTWDDYYKDSFTITPLGEEKVQMVSRNSKDTDEVLIDNDYVTVTRIGYEVSDSLEMQLYIVSKTDNPITLSISDCALNGTMCDPFWATEVMGNKVALSTVEWYSSTLEDSNLAAEDVSDISFTMSVYNTDSWDDYAKESISITKE